MNFKKIKSLIGLLIILGFLVFVLYQYLSGDVIAPIKSADNSSISCPPGYQIVIHFRSSPECYRNK